MCVPEEKDGVGEGKGGASIIRLRLVSTLWASENVGWEYIFDTLSFDGVVRRLAGRVTCRCKYCDEEASMEMMCANGSVSSEARGGWL